MNNNYKEDRKNFLKPFGKRNNQLQENVVANATIYPSERALGEITLEEWEG